MSILDINNVNSITKSWLIDNYFINLDDDIWYLDIDPGEDYHFWTLVYNINTHDVSIYCQSIYYPTTKFKNVSPEKIYRNIDDIFVLNTIIKHVETL